MDGQEASPVVLGPFELQRVLGRGGMGEVWAGVHRALRVPIAAKVITPESAHDARYQRAFRREVRAVARLDHPSVVWVLEYGAVDAAAAASSGERLREGSPYVIMERVAAPSLQAWTPRAWPQVRRVALEVLDALAYAHARGVLHRDLKPDNILHDPARASPESTRLIDFGLAALDMGPGARGGTPGYMAPEQIDAHQRSQQGPWTDLYALGCVMYGLCAGAPVFAGASVDEVLERHAVEMPPRLKARFAVPTGLEGWLAALLAKSPRVRFQRAADAAAALLALGPDAVAPARSALVVEGGEAEASLGGIFGWSAASLMSEGLEGGARTSALGGSMAWSEAWASRVDAGGLGATGGETLGEPSAAARVARPLVEDWRGAAESHRPVLGGVGARLFTLRAVPLVGREAERDALWSALVEAARDARPVCRALIGPSGVGASHIARWLCARAHELGAAHVVSVAHAPDAVPGDGLRALVRDALGGPGLGWDGPAVEAHVRRRFAGDRRVTEEDLEIWAALMRAPDAANERAPSVAREARARAEALVRLLEVLGQTRPVVVWLDDALYDRATLRWCAHVLQQPAARALPVLLLLTAQAEALPERDEARAELEQLVGEAGDPRRVEVEPLDARSQRLLIERRVGLSPALTHRVVERARGNALLAVELIGELVARDALIPTDQGFDVQEGARLELPDALHRATVQRLDRAVSAMPSPARQLEALEVAAALGGSVERAVWRDACARAGCSPEPGLEDALLDRRLAVHAPGGWRFAHGFARAALQRRARDGGREARHHVCCAEAIVARAGGALDAMSAERLERLGRHAMFGGRFELACRALPVAAQDRFERGDLFVARALLDGALAAHDAAGTAPLERARVEVEVLKARTLRFMNLEAAQASTLAPLVAQLGALAARAPDLACAVRFEQALVVRQQGRLDEALAALATLVDDPSASDETFIQAACYIARIGLTRGERERAERYYTLALERGRAVGDEVAIANAMQGLGEVAKANGDMDKAGGWLRQALERQQRLKRSLSVLGVQGALADIALRTGRYAEAEALHRVSVTAALALGAHLYAQYARFNLACTLLGAERDYDEARLLLFQILQYLKSQPSPFLELGVYAGLLDVHAHARDWDALASALARVEALVAVTGTCEDSDGLAALRAAKALVGAGGPRELGVALLALAERLLVGPAVASYLEELRALKRACASLDAEATQATQARESERG